MKHLAAASDMRGRGSRALEERANPDEVVMAPAKLEPDFVGRGGPAWIRTRDQRIMSPLL